MSKTHVSSVAALLAIVLVAMAQTKQRTVTWVEPEGLTEKDRMQDRPGNYHVLPAVASFLDGLYEKEPRAANIVFPFDYMGKQVKTVSEFEGALTHEMRKGQQAVNMRRRYTFQVRSMLLYDLTQDAQIDQLRKRLADEKIDPAQLLDSHQRHKGGSKRSVGVLLRAELYSLQSDKIEGEGKGSPMLFHLIFKEGKWLVAMYSEE